MEFNEVFNLISSVILSGTGIWATLYFSNANKKREDDKMMKDLFHEFNDRYNILNDSLIIYLEPRDGFESIKSSKTDHNIKKVAIFDYFNLCAEEYYWRKKNRIDNVVWKSWQTGMNYWYNHSSGIVKKLWKEEMKKTDGPASYYIDNGNEFFKDYRSEG
jgi:hypothetical protein